MNIKEVALRAGVAPSSVTRVLNGHPNVSRELRARVLAAVAETGYRPDLLASGLRRGSSRTIGIIVGDIINPMLAQMVDHFESKVREAGYSVLLSNSHGNPDQDVESVMLLRQRRVDGLAVMCVDETNEELQRAIASLTIPVVLLDRVMPGLENASGVVNDHYNSTFELTNHLLDAGHERILHLGGRAGATYPGRERRRGIRAACHARGIEVVPELMRDGNPNPTPECAEQVMSELFERRDPPTAVVVGPNMLLPGVLTTLRQKGMRVGRDVALACLDDVLVAGLHDPPLTALYRDTEQIAGTAADFLLSGSEASPRGRTVVLPMEVRYRASTGVTAREVLAARVDFQARAEEQGSARRQRPPARPTITQDAMR